MCVLLMGFWGWWCYFNAFSRSFSAIARHMPFNKTYAGMLMPQVFRIFRIQYKCCMWCRKWNDCKTGAESMQLHYRSPMFPYCNIVQKHFVQSNCRFMFLTPLKQQVILSIHLIVWTSVVGTTPPKINMSPDFRDHFKVQGQFIFQPEIFRGGVPGNATFLNDGQANAAKALALDRQRVEENRKEAKELEVRHGWCAWAVTSVTSSWKVAVGSGLACSMHLYTCDVLQSLDLFQSYFLLLSYFFHLYTYRISTRTNTTPIKIYQIKTAINLLPRKPRRVACPLNINGSFRWFLLKWSLFWGTC